MANEQQTDKRTASQKIEDMERGLMAIYQTADNMARDMMLIKDALKLLGNKVDSIVKASVSGQPINDEVLSKIMVQNNVDELKKKVDNLIAQGILVPETTITEDSFIVGQDINAQGELASPRLQFVLSVTGTKEFQAKFLGAQVGQTLEIEEGKNKFMITESYAIQSPKAPEAPVAAPEVAPETAPEQAPTEAPAAQPALSVVPDEAPAAQSEPTQSEA